MFENLTVMPGSKVTFAGTDFALVMDKQPGKSLLAIAGDCEGFSGETTAEGILLAPLTAENALVLRQRLKWLQPTTLGLQISAGFGDRLGLATPGHVEAVRGTGVAPIF